MQNKNLPIYLGAIALIIFLAVIGWQTAETKNPGSATMPKAIMSMPNLDGEEAKKYLEQQGLGKSLGKAIEAARYSVNWVEHAPVSNQSGAFEAKNTQQEFAAYFTSDEVNIVPRVENEKWKFSLKLKGYGRGEQIESVGEGEIKIDRNRVEISKSKIVEWFENKPEGLEQGFNVLEKPSTANGGEHLRLVLNLNGDLEARTANDGQSLSLVKKSGENVLRYDKLKSWDVNGKELASRMELDGDELSLVVDDAEAVYPVTIDPTFTQIKKLTASDGGVEDIFGSVVAVSGNTAVIGALGDNDGQGAAYIFERNSGGANGWSQVKKITASDGAPNGHFGESAAIDGNTVVVGSRTAAYIFGRNAGSAGNWGEVKILTQDLGGDPTVTFGAPLGISENTLIVGLNINNPEGPSARAFIYDRDQGGLNNWGLVKEFAGGAIGISGDTAIIGSNGSQGAIQILRRDEGGVNNWGRVKSIFTPVSGFLAITAAFSDDLLVIGGFNLNNGFSNGEAYVFGRNKGGAENWGLVKMITASDGAAGDFFGIAVGISNDRIIIGAALDDVGANENQGSAYIFERNAGGADNWGEVKHYIASDGAAEDRFGVSVAIDGNTVMVGATTVDIGSNANQGAAYVFIRSNDSWNQDAKPLPANCTVDDASGWSVAISGDTAIVGALAEDVGANANQGAAYIFERDAGGANNWGLVKTIAAADGAANAYFGWSVGIDGDTAIIGVFADDTGAITTRGAAYIFERNSGGANNWGQVKKITASDGALGDFFGWSVAVSGNTTIVGAISDDVGASNAQGSAYVYERNAGGANNWGEVKHIIASDGASGDQLGKSVAISGDTAIAGADGDDIGANGNRGSAYVFERDYDGAGNWGQIRKITASDGAASDQFGYGVAIDSNMIIVGAWQDDVGANNAQGSAYIYERNTSGANNWGQVKKIVASDGSADDRLGLSVAVSGDTVIVGSLYDQIGANTFQGSAYIFKQNTGGANNWGQVKKIVATDGAAGDQFGVDVAVSDDTAIVGAAGDDVGGAVGQGSAYIFVSNSDVWNQQANISPPPPTNCGTSDLYGRSVAISGDTAVIGAPGDDVGINANQGSVYILERNQGGVNNWGLVKLLTASDGAANDYFGLSVAISGNSVIVGANFDDVGSNIDQGSAYIFERNSGGTNNFGEVKKLTASDGATGDRFSYSVAINGNTAIVGATRDNADQGSAYIFERNAGGANNWGATKKLVAAGSAASDFFGSSVAVKNDTIFVGSPSDDVGTTQSQGSVHIFERNAGGANNWARTKYLTVTDGAFQDSFGWAIAVSGNLLIVTAPIDGIGDFTGEGSAYIFERNTGGAENWGQVKKIRASDAGQQDQFGRAVGIFGDAVIVGSPLDDVSGNENQGSAYIFEQNAGGANNWGQVKKLTASDGAAGDWLGDAVAVSGDNFLLGAYLANSPAPFSKQSNNLFGGNTKGAGYVFKGIALAPTAASVAVGGRVLTTAGRGIANARVTLTDANGATRAAITNPFGYYRFDEVQAGGTYIFSVSHNRYRFRTQILTVNEELVELNFTAEK